MASQTMAMTGKRQRRGQPPRKRWFALIMLILVLLLFWNSTWLGRLIYPIHYKKDIERYAAQYEVDPLLVAAIIRVESNYRPNQESHKGAVGMMQIMPETAQWIKVRDQDSSFSVEDLHDPLVNIRVGTRYLSLLSQQFKQDPIRIIASYNAGPGNVQKWNQNGVWDGREETVQQIPYGETRKYVSKVLYYYRKYETIYSDAS